MEKYRILPQYPVAGTSEQIFTNQVIATDGVELIADLYVPGGSPPFPAIVEITPYGAQQLAKLGETYATRGYLFLAVDARGRYRSSGQWDPLTHDQTDGDAVINWIAKHTLCNARVGTRGHSYSGSNQLLAAIDAPSELQAMVVCVGPGDPFQNVPFQGGAYDLNDLMWLLNMTGRTNQESFDAEDFGVMRFGSESEDLDDNPYDDLTEDAEKRDKSQQKAEEKILASIDAALASHPFKDIDLRFGIRQEIFREWLTHWQLDDYWQSRSVIPRLAHTAVPTLHISGWWDLNGRGATAFYRGMRDRAGSNSARKMQRLIMGPWNHDLKAPDCTALPEIEATQIQRSALHDVLNDEFSWFDQHLMDIVPGPTTQARVRLFITGLYRWVEFDDWPPVSTQPAHYYLAQISKDGRAGLLSMIPNGTQTESVYNFDPEDPTPFSESRPLAERAPFNNANLEQSRNDMLLFNTEPQQTPLALVGEVSLELFARADVSDFDLCVKILDVYPDGRAIYMTDGVIRARFRDGWNQPSQVVPGEINRYAIDLWHLGHVLRIGHSLRLEVASSAFRRFDVNPCTGGDLAEETTSQRATIRILHSETYPSRLILPVCHDPQLVDGNPVG